MNTNKGLTIGLTLVVLIQAVLLAPIIVEALSPQTVEASEVVTLTLGENGLPLGAIVFTVEGQTCIALPNGALECFCPCDVDCKVEAVECAPCDNDVTEAAAPSVSGNTVYTAPTTSIQRTYGNPGQPTIDVTPDNPTTVGATPDNPTVVNSPSPQKDHPPKGNNGLGNGVDNPPPGIAKQGKPQNDAPTAVPGNPQYKGTGSDGTPNSQDHGDKGNNSQDHDKGKGKDKGK